MDGCSVTGWDELCSTAAWAPAGWSYLANDRSKNEVHVVVAQYTGSIDHGGYLYTGLGRLLDNGRVWLQWRRHGRRHKLFKGALLLEAVELVHKAQQGCIHGFKEPAKRGWWKEG